MRERHVPSEVLIVRIAREDRPGLGIDGRHDVQVVALAWRPERQLAVPEEAQRARYRVVVGEREERELHGLRRVDEYVELVADAMRQPCELRQTGGVADQATVRRCTARRRA